MQFQSFDDDYLSRLKAGDARTQEHFAAYFSTLINLKLRSRLSSSEAIEDVRQETLARFFVALRDKPLQRPERLASFVNSICNNVLLEYYRSSARQTSLDDESKDLASFAMDPTGLLASREAENKIREIMQQLPERDRRLLQEVFLEERDKGEVCRDFGVDREYLRALLHRMKEAFKSMYLKDMASRVETLEAHKAGLSGRPNS